MDTTTALSSHHGEEARTINAKVITTRRVSILGFVYYSRTWLNRVMVPGPAVSGCVLASGVKGSGTLDRKY
jgi:hypothetical protein